MKKIIFFFFNEILSHNPLSCLLVVVCRVQQCKYCMFDNFF